MAALQPVPATRRAARISGAVELGEAVDRLGLEVEGVVGVAVPVLVDRGVAQAEVGGKIDHLEVARELRDHLLGGGVRQGAEG